MYSLSVETDTFSTERNNYVKKFNLRNKFITKVIKNNSLKIFKKRALKKLLNKKSNINKNF